MKKGELREPRTAAGRALVEDEPRLVTGEHDMLTRVLAIEAEAAMNGWNQHVEAIGEPDRAAFMEGYNAAKDDLAEVAAPAGLDVDYAIRLQKIADALVPGIRHDFGLEAARLLQGTPR